MHLAKLRKRLVDDGDGTDVADPKIVNKGPHRQRPYEAWKPSERPARNEV